MRQLYACGIASPAAEAFAPPAVLFSLPTRPAPLTRPPTEKQQLTLRYRMNGYDNLEIGKFLGIASGDGVKTHLRAIHKRYSTSSLAAATTKALILNEQSVEPCKRKLRFTPPELYILLGLALDQTYVQIAETIGRSEYTAKEQGRAIRQKIRSILPKGERVPQERVIALVFALGIFATEQYEQRYAL